MLLFSFPSPAPVTPTTHDGLGLDDRLVRDLPLDLVVDDLAPREVVGAVASRVHATPVAAPRLLAASDEVADALGLDAAQLGTGPALEVLAGNQVPVGSHPWAYAYGGHQFGQWAGQLGDGRALVLGGRDDRDGRHQLLQLKGAGPTPYSRFADGRAVLRSSIREFLASEAMAHLGVPTSRALTLVATGDEVVRDVRYDGHPAPEPGAVVCRVAPTWLRFGSFELPASRGDEELLQRLVDHAVDVELAPDLAAFDGDDPCAPAALRLFRLACARTADTLVGWMRVGFVHGVMNTDNLSVSGLTIDYGPFGWLEAFDPDWTPNTTDLPGRRYRFGAQPGVAAWNLVRLGNALLALGGDVDAFGAAVDSYGTRYADGFAATTRARLGWGNHTGSATAEVLVEQLYGGGLLQRAGADHTGFFRDLARVPVDADATDEALLAPLVAVWFEPALLAPGVLVRDEVVAWLRAWATEVRATGVVDADRIAATDALNPRYVLRGHLLDEVIAAATAGDPAPLHELHDVVRRPYEEQPGREHWARKRPGGLEAAGGSMLSCSS